MNKDLFLDNKRYISAGRAAESFGYSQDYVGSLVRNGQLPGKMIGRSWYVELDAITLHSKSKSRKNKNLRNQKSKSRLDAEKNLINESTVNAINNSTIVYEKDSAPRLPELLKRKESRVGVNITRAIAARVSATLLSTIMVVSWADYTLPHMSESFINVASGLSRAIGFGTEQSSEKSFVAAVIGANSTEKSEVETVGLVVEKDESDHAGLVSRIKKSFSDEVNVYLDEDISSGVITPIFRSENDENYAFVLVPLKEKND
ncbi:MAG: hypothetical protein AB200_01595 [Parcubacteria bacterium C7867-005]|nr:MAG: hypothetical protein AB200_01595 [Parcubacteria bacterium C7867-005]